MRRYILPGLLIIASAASAQTTVDIASDSHYHLLLENDKVRVFSLILKPKEEVYVQHEHSFITVTLQDCEVIMWRAGQSAIQHFHVHEGEVGFVSLLSPQAGGIRDVSAGEYRNITVEFLDPNLGGTAPNGASIGPPVDLRGKFSNSVVLGTATAVDIQLLASDSLAPPPPSVAELLIPVTDVSFEGSGKH
jgi:hypothetical protein